MVMADMKEAMREKATGSTDMLLSAIMYSCRETILPNERLNYSKSAYLLYIFSMGWFKRTSSHNILYVYLVVFSFISVYQIINNKISNDKKLYQ